MGSRYNMLLEILKVDVLEILRRLVLYAMIDKPEISNTREINKTEKQTEEFHRFCLYESFGAKIT
jgi:hypothetical protein